MVLARGTACVTISVTSVFLICFFSHLAPPWPILYIKSPLLKCLLWFLFTWLDADGHTTLVSSWKYSGKSLDSTGWHLSTMCQAPRWAPISHKPGRQWSGEEDTGVGGQPQPDHRRVSGKSLASLSSPFFVCKNGGKPRFVWPIPNSGAWKSLI